MSTRSVVKDAIDEFAYDQMVENALRGVVREALSITEKQGLPGFNHFYITFRTDHPGVLLPTRLKATHPHTMTIVLQNQFWDLSVYDEAFGVVLSFSGRREHLTIPFDSITAFVDPHANFGLQFHVLLPDGQIVDDDDGDGDESPTDPDACSESDEDRRDRARSIRDALQVLVGELQEEDSSRRDTKKKAPAGKPAPEDGPEDPDDPGSSPGGSNVVAFDSFRKKH
ncbi:hypothetical protein IHV25_04120 [Phaeovibrio sulfidiphilus]|uniref:Stringent starvation protein B n=1 Tax=Phaeovibrio sulfidiphilus TaxID=1220600 RepID=A0A8J6YW79_9PROT|nr:ClpXP protease specificity-enhancing factor SspB [Phaeovibrio sulfidiphilus]MBE1236837.1 hypothetical protein [Phaeovibrio sulfidiphilus]